MNECLLYRCYSFLRHLEILFFFLLGKTVEKNGKYYTHIHKEMVKEQTELLALFSIIWVFTFCSNQWDIGNCIFVTRTGSCCRICISARSDYLVTQFYYIVLPLTNFSWCYWSTWVGFFSFFLPCASEQQNDCVNNLKMKCPIYPNESSGAFLHLGCVILFSLINKNTNKWEFFPLPAIKGCSCK